MGDHEVTTIYVSKFALTQGVLEFHAAKISGDMAIVSGEFTSYFHKKQWHRTLSEAIARGEEMRVKRIASLRKQIAKLENLKIQLATNREARR